MHTRISLTALAFALAATPALAASEHNHGAMAAPAQQAPVAKAALVEGLVKKVDKAGAKVTLAHGPLLNLGMTMPMTMVFRVKDAAWLDQMKEGDKIRFSAENVNGAITVVQYEPAK
jgi:Cu/Ag efflux protein CusF